jgi:hypothetical protein
MFFAPTLLHLVQSKRVHLLCLSTGRRSRVPVVGALLSLPLSAGLYLAGNFYGRGATRRVELERAAQILRIASLTIIEDPALQVGDAASHARASTSRLFVRMACRMCGLRHKSFTLSTSASGACTSTRFSVAASSSQQRDSQRTAGDHLRRAGRVWTPQPLCHRPSPCARSAVEREGRRSRNRPREPTPPHAADIFAQH